MPFVIPEETSVISDTTTSTTTTWSSTKIDAEIGMGGGGGGVTINDENPSLTTVYSGTKTQTLINGITDLNFVGAYNPGVSYGVNDVATYDGSSWRRVNANGGNVGDTPSLSSYFWEALAVKGDQGIQGIQGDAGLSSSLFEYRLDRNTFVATGIASGDIRFNNASLDLATNIWVSHLDDKSHDVETFLAITAVGSRILIQDKSLSSTWITYQVTGTVSQVIGSYVSFPVVYLSSSNGIDLTHNLLVFISVEFVAVPTIAVGTVTTGAPGSSAIVVNSGSSQNAVFDFTIPRGDVGSSGGGGSGFSFNSMNNWTTSITTGSKTYMYVCVIPYNTTISGFTIYTPSGSDLFRVGIYRGALRLSSSGTITLVGQSATGTPGSITQPGVLPAIPFTHRAITVVSGQSLSFLKGDLITFGFHSTGITSTYYGSPIMGTTIQELAFQATANYQASGFPSTLSSSNISTALTQKLCLDFY